MATENENLTVVIADDDADDREFIIEAFNESKIPYRAVEIGDGHELVELLYNRGKNDISATEPRLVFLDLNMPKMDGLKALERIKMNSDLSHLPIYVFTCSHNSIDEAKAMELGASGYYRKGAAFQDIVRMVKEVCGAVK